MSFIKKNNWLWFYTVIALLVKSLLFLGFTNSIGNSSYSFKRIFWFAPPVLVYICFIALFLSFSFLFKNKFQSWYLIIFNIIISFLIIMDLWYYRAFGSFISMYLLKETANLNNLSDSIFSMIKPVDMLFAADIIPIIFIMIIGRKKFYVDAKRSVLTFVLMFLISVSYICFDHYIVDVLHISELGRAELFRVCWAPNQTMSNLSPIGYHIYDIYNFAQDSKPLVLTAQDKKDINSWFESKKENIPDNEYKGMFKGKNLMIIQVESLENFVIGQKINGQEITPNLNKLLGNSLYFPDYYEQVYNGTSSDADLMTNTSIYPVRRGSTFFRYPGNTYNSLPKLMQGMGYSTLAVHPDNASYWNWMPALKSIGFQRCIDASYFDQSETIGMGISDGSYLRQVEPLVEKQKQPFYMFLVTLTSHAPFNLPQQYRELKLDPALDKTKLGGYFQSMHYTDKQLGIFIDKLQKSGVLNNTVIALYGDHCGIHKFYQQEVDQIQPSQSWWLDNHHHIPLIIYQKNLKGKTVSTIGGEIDLMPTISYLMGIDESKYADTTMGRNLLKTNKNFAVLADGKYVGTAASSKEKNNSIQGLDIANKIIESNYFKNK